MRTLACANQQEKPSFAGSAQRLAAAQRALGEPGLTLPRLVDRFLEPPLHSRRVAFPTPFTAVYRPAEGRVDYVWPGKTWSRRSALSCRGNTSTTTATSHPGSRARYA